MSTDDLLSDFEDPFIPILGKVKGMKVRLTKETGVNPRFCKIQPVLFADQNKTEDILCLVKENILQPVKTTESALPTVSVLKQDGCIRDCCDFKPTSNKGTKLEQYPLPKIVDNFPPIIWCNMFFKARPQRYILAGPVRRIIKKNLLIVSTRKDLFHCTRLPFGVVFALAILQREIEKILQPLNCSSFYLVDLLIPSKMKRNISQLEGCFKTIARNRYEVAPK